MGKINLHKDAAALVMIAGRSMSWKPDTPVSLEAVPSGIENSPRVLAVGRVRAARPSGNALDPVEDAGHDLDVRFALGHVAAPVGSLSRTHSNGFQSPRWKE
ncbi:hypothetical protein PG997_012364 [Apiospora hydei]|uniref:DUF397 domain-containing protein n=1 Tax=Apiospora hydei TaxID=1337664 RepID=A0ABR1V3X4_9PEZI